MNEQERAWREEFPVTADLCYLNSCSLAPLPRSGAAALAEFTQQWSALGSRAWYDHWVGEYEALRTDLAHVLGAGPDEVALEPNVSAALVTVATTFDYAKRPKVVVADIDFPTDGQIWHALADREVQVEIVRSPDGVGVPLEVFERAVDERTALVCTGHVYYRSGAIQDVAALARICHAKGAALVVDAYQSIGAFPFDVRASGVDYLVGGALKWLMGGPGLAFLYARREVAERARPQALGWWGVRDPFSFDVEHLEYGPGARRFEYGTPAMAAVFTARAGIALLERIGIPTVRERHQVLSQRLLEGALEQGWTANCPARAAERTAIVTLRHGDAPRAVEALRRARVIADARPGLIRLSPHYFNTAGEVDAALEALAPLREAVPAG